MQSGTHGHCKVKLKRDWEITKDKKARCITQNVPSFDCTSWIPEFLVIYQTPVYPPSTLSPLFLTQNSPTDTSFRKIIPTASSLSQSQPPWFLCSVNQNSWKQTWNFSLGSYSQPCYLWEYPFEHEARLKMQLCIYSWLALRAFMLDRFQHRSRAEKGRWGQRNRRKAHSVYCGRLISVGVIGHSSWVSFFKSLQFLAFSSIRYYSTTMVSNTYIYVDRCINKYIRLLRWVKYIPINCCNSFLVLIKLTVPEVTKRNSW